MNNKALCFLIAGVVMLLVTLPCLYFGIVLAEYFHSLWPMPIPAMSSIFTAFMLFHKAEQSI
jgi:hypothetical protein